MNKSKLSMGDIILTNEGVPMLIVGAKKENDTWMYNCRERLSGGDMTEHYVREHEIKAVCREQKWVGISHLQEVGLDI